MGAIKDAIDLMLTLEARIKDRKTLDLFLPIKQKILEAEIENSRIDQKFKQENLDLKAAFFDEKIELISRHNAEKDKLNTDHSAIVTKITADHAAIVEKIKAEHAENITQLKNNLDKCEFELNKTKSSRVGSIKIERG